MRFRTFGGAHAAAVYTFIAVWATWPLSRGLAHDVAWDLGDPVLVIWAIAWDCTQLLAILSGDLSRASTFFDANIFAPSTHTLAFSEHFIGQSLQVLPVYALTGNAVLCYNLLYLSTFVLSGLGAFLFVRELTGSRAAGFTAGLLFAFAPYRFPQSSHLQVLSAQWMPLALYGFRRYFDSGRRGALAWAALSLVMQNLSCGYYMLYFSPFAAAYVLAEMTVRGQWRSVRVWRDVVVAGAAVVALTVPVFLPYLALRDLQTRTLAEVARYSADIYSYLTAFTEHPLWGGLQAFPKPEGQLFPGLAAVILAAIGVFWSGAPEGAPPREHAPAQERTWLRVFRPARPVIAVLLLLAIAHMVLFVTVLFGRRFAFDLGFAVVRVSDATSLLTRAAFAAALVLILSPRARANAAAFLWPRGAWLVAALMAAWLSLGPSPESMGRPLDLASPYRVLYEVVPGFDGVRAPARFWMVALLAMSVLGGFAAVRLGARPVGRAVLAAAWLLCLAEARLSPFVVNGMSPVPGFTGPEPRLRAPGEAPAVYQAVRRAPSNMVLAELPLGQPDFDLRAMYYSTLHWRKLVNGYSGFTPVQYGPLVAALGAADADGERAWTALRDSGATAVIVHEGAYPDGGGARLTSALRAHGARELARDGSDVLLSIY